MSQYYRKNLEFNPKKDEHLKAYELLNLLGYKQSAFIILLINKFMEDNHIYSADEVAGLSADELMILAKKNLFSQKVSAKPASLAAEKPKEIVKSNKSNNFSKDKKEKIQQKTEKENQIRTEKGNHIKENENPRTDIEKETDEIYAENEPEDEMDIVNMALLRQLQNN